MADENEDSEDESIEDEVATEVVTGSNIAPKGDKNAGGGSAFNSGTGKTLTKDQQLR